MISGIRMSFCARVDKKDNKRDDMRSSFRMPENRLKIIYYLFVDGNPVCPKQVRDGF